MSMPGGSKGFLEERDDFACLSGSKEDRTGSGKTDETGVKFRKGIGRSGKHGKPN